jgi:release factor glutamine methyltransferase
MLKAAGDIENPSLESEVLLKHLLKTDRVYLYLEPDIALEKNIESALFQGIERLLRGEPLAYVIGSREFFGIDFYVDPRVLIPRPETELIVEEGIRFAQKHPVVSVADIGTGSGVIAVSLAKNLPQPLAPTAGITGDAPSLKIYATDISAPALEVAGINCLKHNVTDIITLLQGDLLDPLPEPVDLLTANLPYVRRTDLASLPSARFEPRLALDGGESGLESLTRFCRVLEGQLRPAGCILLEIGMGQDQAVTALLRNRFPGAKIEVIPDLAGIKRVVKMVVQENTGR